MQKKLQKLQNRTNTRRVSLFQQFFFGLFAQSRIYTDIDIRMFCRTLL